MIANALFAAAGSTLVPARGRIALPIPYRFLLIHQYGTVQYRYDGKARQARRDLKHLVGQGLVQRCTTYPDRNVFVGLTRKGRRYIEHYRPANAASPQVFYHGFVKRREARVAAIYRLYQRESERITRAGGKIK
jgi:hypothetical protein